MKYKYILFDLDGTLTDSKPGITRSAAYALEAFGFPNLNPEELGFFVGPPLLDTFMDRYGFDEKTAHQVIAKFRERYKDIGIFENSPYSGIKEVLAKLKEDGLTLGVATSKPHQFMLRILDKFELAKYFTVTQGAKSDSVDYRKAMVVKEALNDLGLKAEQYKEVLMVGDRFHDIEAAKECGIDSLGVLYGYGNRNEMKKYQADAIADTVKDIYRIIIQ